MKSQIDPNFIAERSKDPHFVAAREWDFRRTDEACLATFWRQATPGTTYWRCYLPAMYLPGQVVNFGEGEIEYDEEEDLLTLHDQQGVAIWQFLGDDGRARFAMKQMSHGIPTVMELDDNYLTHPHGYSGANWAYRHADAYSKGRSTGYSIEAHRALTPRFEALIVSTYALAEEYDHLNKHIFVCENSIDPTDWNVEREEREIPVFGYYGSTGHAKDFATAKKAVKFLARKRDFVFIGYVLASWTGRTAPWQPGLMAARQNLGLIDIGLCPLAEDRFSRCKSDVKAMEYAMAGVMPIVSRTEPYRWWWDDMDWPWVASSEKEWNEVLQSAAKLGAAEVASVAAEAKRLVLEHRTIQANIGAWKEVIDFVS